MSELEPRSRYAPLIFQAEETARQLAKVLQPQPIEPRKKRTPDVKIHNNITLNGEFELLNLRDFEGEIEEVLVESTSSSYKIAVEVDGKTLWDGDYNYYNQVSQKLEQIDASLTSSSYWVHIENVPFSRSVKIKVYGSNLTLTRAIVKYWILQ